MVSIVLPTYNREKTIYNAINSILEQTYTDFELIIVDDGSTDNTEDVIRKIHDSRIKYVKQKNSGACSARNRGIDLAKGEYIAFHDSDDIWHKNKLEIELKELKDNNCDIVFCLLQKIKNGKVIEIKPNISKKGFLNPVKNLFGIGTQSLLAKKEVFKKYKFDEDFPMFQEFELLYRISKEYTIYCVNIPLVDYYVGDDSISSNPYKMFNAGNLIIKKHPNFKTEYPIMAEKIAHYLISEANKMKKENKKDQKDFLKLALIFSKNIKILFKVFVTKFNLYYFFFRK